MSTAKVRIYEVSKVLGKSNAEVMAILEKDFGVTPKSHSSSIEQKLADALIAKVKGQPQAEKAAEKPATAPTPVKQAEPQKRPESSPPQAAAPRPSEQPARREQSAPSQQPARRDQPPAPPQPGVRRDHPSSSQPGVRRDQPYQPSGQRPAAPGMRPGVGPAQTPQATSRPGAYPPAAGRPNQSNNFPRPQSRQKKSRRQVEYEKMMSQRRVKEEEEARLAALPKIAAINEPLTVRELSQILRVRETEMIKNLFMKGMMVTVNQTLDVDFARSVAKEFEFEIEEKEKDAHEGEYTMDLDSRKAVDEAKYQNLVFRAPVVSIMGHVDHGKTTLLDAIRETRHKIVDTEAGGITQSIGAYTVEKDDRRVVFLDTPGHEAFTAMRMRGAKSTDIAILVVAADDGVMPQTIEAINHAKAAQIPIIVAVNKIDKEDADPDRVLVQLSEYGLNAEKWGGDTLTVEVSALQKLGIDDVLDTVLLVSELLDLKADPTVAAEGVVIESQLDKRMGPVATVLVQQGTIKVGDNVLVGSVGGRVRALIDDHGARVQQAGPATPVEILGLSGVPKAGDTFQVIREDKRFKQMLAEEKTRERAQRLGLNRSMAGMSQRTEEEDREQQFNILVKADTQGSLEAVVDMLQKMATDEVKLNIIHSGTGDISEADAMLASTAKALVIGFNVKEDANAHRLIEQEDLNLRTYDVIYHITEDVEKFLLGQLAKETEEVEAGTAEVRQIFTVGKNSVIAGCMVTNGKMIRNAKAVVLRKGKPVFTGQLDNLKRFKDDAKEVASGYECGISFDRFNDLQEGDIITVYTVKELERTSL